VLRGFGRCGVNPFPITAGIKPLHLAPGLSLPIEIAGQTTAIFGIRGSGKTNTAGALVEELLDRNQPVAIVDPTDGWWGMRAGRDGEQSGGYPIFIFGGSHGDVPLQETDGKVVAEFLVREQVSVILSLRHLRKAAQRRFMREFCEELYHLKGKDENRTPLTVVIDEAPLFVPQKVMGDVAFVVGAVEDLIARGRNAGFGVVLISQRSATLNADVRTQADTMICHRLPASLDRKAIKDWFEENASVDDLGKILSSLATLKNGEGWVWSPALGVMSRVQMRMRRTFDSSATPKVGQVIRPPKKLADIDLGKLREKMTAAVEQAKADDPKELRKRIAELEQVASSRDPVADPVFIDEVERRGYERAIAECGGIFSSIKSASGELETALTASRNACDRLIVGLNLPAAVVTRPVAPQRTETKERSGGPTPARPSPARPSGSATLSKAERKILTALAQYPNGRTKTQIAILTSYAHSGGGFNNALSSLRSKGFAEGSEPLRITPAGISGLGSYDPLPAGKELAAHWMTQLSKAERACLQALIDVYPNALDKSGIAVRAGYEVSGGGFNNALSRLRTLELIQGHGLIRASKDLF
jgi:hypothetical protein